MTEVAATGWAALRALTAARIGVARTGASLGTGPMLDMRLAHARARDAVAAALDVPALRTALRADAVEARSRVADRREFLLRPDLGRALHPDDAAALARMAGRFDLAVVLGDGLSAQAVQNHAPAVLDALRPFLPGWALAPSVIVRNARVKLGDAVAVALGAGAVLVLIGERPGLSAPDSLGAYLTWAPGPDTTDADRNCVSNIRPDGLPYAAAAARIGFLLGAMRRLGVSGVTLKDSSDVRSLPP